MRSSSQGKALLSIDGVIYILLSMWLAFLKVLAFLPGLSNQRVQWLRRLARQARARYLYRCFSRLARIQGVLFLNYGYAPLEEESPVQLEEADEPNRVFIQLYHRVVGQVDLRGRDVLEVSCGHGGGASYVARYLRPATMTAVDLNPRAIQMCRDTIRAEGLEFQVANALDLPVAECSFDAVLNVEASHGYPSFAKFLTEVRRVLRPGGHFLFADLRWKHSEQEALQQALANSGLEIVDFEDITQNVVAALERYAEHRRAWIAETIPRRFRGVALRSFAVPGSRAFELLQNGEGAYLRFILQKPAV